MKKLRRKHIVLAAVAIVLLGGYFTWSKARAGGVSVSYQTAAVQRGMITQDVNGSGNMVVGNSANVMPSVSGTVTGLAVKQGDQVKAGQVLFTISNDQLDINVGKSYGSLLQAQQSLASAESQLAQSQLDLDNASQQANLNGGNIAALQAKEQAAQAGVDSAQQSYNVAALNYKNNPTPQNLQAELQAQQSFENAQASWLQSQSDLAKAEQQSGTAPENIDVAQQKLSASQEAISTAQQNVNMANSDYQNQQTLAAARTVTAPIDGTITSLNVRNGDTINSNGSVSSSSSGSSSSTSAGSASSGSSASSGASSGGAAAGGSSAGASGTSAGSAGGSTSGGSAGGSSGGSSAGGSTSGGSAGGAAGGGSSGSGSASSSGSSGGGSSGSSGGSSAGNSSVAAVIQDMSSLSASVQLSEVDVANVQAGQKASLTFDAVPDLSLTGKVTKMDSAGTVSQGVVNFTVTVGVDSPDERIKPGMSVTTDITTQVKQDVLTVPSSAIKSQGGNAYVQVMDASGNVSNHPVSTGITNDTLTEITNGLTEGDSVVTQAITSGGSQQNTPAGGGLGGLGGGGGAGGMRVGGGGMGGLGGGSGGYRGGGG